MLSWITGGKPDHPMADMKKARELASALADQTSFKALDEAASWLESLMGVEGFKPDHRLALIDLLDRSVKSHQFRLGQEYLDAPRMQKPYESRLWNTCFGFWRSLGGAYVHCIERYQGGAPGESAAKKDLPLIVGRALRALGVQVKWTLLRYGLVEDRIWRDLGAAYLFAESQGFADRRIAIYPGQHGESGAQEEFLKALMLVMSSPDSLAPNRMHIAERIIASVGRHFSLRPKPAAGCYFYFDLALHQPPARAHKDTVAAPMTRFFGAGAAAQELRDLGKEIREKDGVPAGVNLSGNFDRETVLSVLEHLAYYWSDKPPLRSSQRRELATRVTVVPGFPEIVKWIEAALDTSSLEFTGPDLAESWIVFNASDGGYGAIVPQVKGDWLRIGNLLGLQPETSNAYGVGVIRRVTRDVYQQRRVGIEVLGRIAIPAQLSLAGVSGEPLRQGAPVLLLSTKPDKNREVAILMGAGTFTPRQQFRMQVTNKTYLLAPARLVEGGEDFDSARFKVVKQL